MPAAVSFSVENRDRGAAAALLAVAFVELGFRPQVCEIQR
jgi:hypothetical protein